MPWTFVTDVCVFVQCPTSINNWWLKIYCHQSMIEKCIIINQELENIPSSVTQRSSCWLQILAKMKSRTIEVLPWNVSMSCLQKLKAAMHFLLHWRKLASIASKADIIANWKSSWTLCATAPCLTWEKNIQAALVYWHLWMIVFLCMCLSFVSREW